MFKEGCPQLYTYVENSEKSQINQRFTLPQKYKEKSKSKISNWKEIIKLREVMSEIDIKTNTKNQ